VQKCIRDHIHYKLTLNGIWNEEGKLVIKYNLECNCYEFLVVVMAIESLEIKETIPTDYQTKTSVIDLAVQPPSSVDSIVWTGGYTETGVRGS